MFFVDTIEVAGLGNRGCLAGGRHTAVAVDPPRDVDRVIAAAARRGIQISQVVETHVHNDSVTGGLELARLTGAACLVRAWARVSSRVSPCTTATARRSTPTPACPCAHWRLPRTPRITRHTCWRRTARRSRCSPADRC